MHILHFIAFSSAILAIQHSTTLAKSQAPFYALRQLRPILKYIDDNQDQFIDELRKAVAIPSVSAWVTQRSTYSELQKMITFVQDKLVSLGFSVTLRPVGTPQKMDDDTEEPRPPVILASLGNFSSSKKTKETLLIYGHLDVQPAKISDGWDSDPWALTLRDGALYGRGSSDDKGPVLGWIHAIQAFIRSGVPLPVNIKMILESGEEIGSPGLEEALKKKAGKGGFISNIDLIAISDNYWDGLEVPTLTYGLRGLLPFEVVVSGGGHDLHSGNHGGAVAEPMNDLVWILSQLEDGRGGIPIPGVMEGVDPLKGGEEESYSNIDFTVAQYLIEIGRAFLLYPGSKEDTLMARWRYPSLSIHGIEGAFSDPGIKTVIPGRVRGKASLRLVPHQDPSQVGVAVKAYLEKKWEERGSPNGFKVNLGKAGRPWVGDRGHRNYKAAAAAIRRVYGREPQYSRTGGSIPMVAVLEELTRANVLLLPMGQSDDGAHAQNEKISQRNYIEGTKVFAAYFMELASLSATRRTDE